MNFMHSILHIFFIVQHMTNEIKNCLTGTVWPRKTELKCRFTFSSALGP